jgi:hypothetical protein
MKIDKKLNRLLDNPLQFISRLKIVNKKGKLVYLNPTEEQIKIVEALHRGDSTLILKPRQIGSSTIICAYFFWCAYTSDDPQTYAILSHKLASSKHLLEIHKTFYFNLPVSLQKPLSTDNTTEFRFKDSGAGIVAASSQDRGGLRSFSVSKLHISEFAFADNPDELKATAIAALNDGQLVMESTANYYNDAMHQEVMKVQRGLADWNYLFFPWFQHKSYHLPIPKRNQFEKTEEEIDLSQRYDLNDNQLWWRRSQIKKIGLDKFSREFPETLEDAYKQIGNSYFTQNDLENVEVIKVDNGDWAVLQDPQPDDRYAIGVDVAAGVNRDYSVIFVISKMTYQPVLIYRSNKVNPVSLAEIIMDVSGNYNDALTLIESNNYGNVVINELRHQGFRRFWLTEDGKDWTTTLKSKTLMFENLKTLIREGYIYNIDNITFGEIRSLQVNEKGHIQIPDNLASHGDNAVAMALCSMCLGNVKLPKTTYLPDFIKHKRSQRILQNAGVATHKHRRY